jgi:tRNA U34 5-methylaminomethyl-2-thiouridine-forming methyltransferase MnmC
LERQQLGQPRLWQLFPAQLELATSAHRPILSTDATALVVRRGTPGLGSTVAQGQKLKSST